MPATSAGMTPSVRHHANDFVTITGLDPVMTTTSQALKTIIKIKYLLTLGNCRSFYLPCNGIRIGLPVERWLYVRTAPAYQTRRE
jgi:hypothetical protein